MFNDEDDSPQAWEDWSEEMSDALMMKDLEFEITGSAFLTNIGKEDREMILQAAKETGFEIYIGNSNSVMDDYVAVYTKNHGKDHSPFWNRLRELAKGN